MNFELTGAAAINAGRYLLVHVLVAATMLLPTPSAYVLICTSAATDMENIVAAILTTPEYFVN